MIIIVLLCALVFYVWMYWIWDSGQPHAGEATDLLSRLNRMFVLPEGTVFTIFRGLLLIALFYVVFDHIYASTRKKRRK